MFIDCQMLVVMRFAGPKYPEYNFSIRTEKYTE
jgi:hypothetical protein